MDTRSSFTVSCQLERHVVSESGFHSRVLLWRTGLYGEEIMFQAIVLACLINNMEYCLQLEDQRGPYESMERCEARAFEMSRDVHKHMRGYKPVRWSCRGLPKGSLTR